MPVQSAKDRGEGLEPDGETKFLKSVKGYLFGIGPILQSRRKIGHHGRDFFGVYPRDPHG